MIQPLICQHSLPRTVKMSPIPIAKAAIRLLLRSDDLVTDGNPMGSPSDAASSPHPRPIISRPHLRPGDADAQIAITRYELFLLQLGLVALVSLLAWLGIMLLNHLLPGGGLKRWFLRMTRWWWEKPRRRVRLEESEGYCTWELTETVGGPHGGVRGNGCRERGLDGRTV